MDIPEPEDVEAIVNSPFVVMYWPLIAGAALFFVALARGHPWIAITIAALALGLEATHLGLAS